KLGSDYKKPDAVTVFSRDNYKELIYPLPTRDLLYIGRATEKKLSSRGIFTIGDLANTSPEKLCSFLGKNGLLLYDFANGLENSPVSHIDDTRNVKSIGNSVTASRDLLNFEDVKLTLMVLADSVARRMREQGFLCRNVGVWVRDASLQSFTRQVSFENPIGSANAIIKYGMDLIYSNLRMPFSIRSVGIAVSELCSKDETVQFDIFGTAKREEKFKVLDDVVDKLKFRYGSGCVKPASLLKEVSLTGFSPYDDHTVHPEGWFR
ncbi:MAG: DNA polymerase IV, partial [Clostridia bacterium]|nr:DNA polymerase IV [Clostridia bacterium]